MNKKLLYAFLGVLVLGILVFALRGPQGPEQTSSGPTPAESPAARLALADLGHTPDPAVIVTYQSALDGLKPFCREDESTLASEIWASLKDLRSNGVTAETNLSLMAQIKQSVSGAGSTDCRAAMAAYLVLREPIK